MRNQSNRTRKMIGSIPALVGLICGATLMPAARVVSAQVAAQNWSYTGNLNVSRESHTATLLRNGKVLVAGGVNNSNSAELYDPATGTWSPTGNLNTPRFSHTATLLQNGNVLVAGGVWQGTFLSSAELYDPATGTWQSIGSLQEARCWHTATLLPNGKVLVAGGSPSLFNATSSAELYDPATETWSITGSLRDLDLDQGGARFLHTATLLTNGEVMVAGGETDDGVSDVAELYDPSTGKWTITGRLHTRRGEHTATLLPSGKVLVACGQTSIGNGFGLDATAELYDPAIGNWSVTGSPNTARHFQTATALPGGKVLVAGGSGASNASNTPLNTAELYDPSTGTWSFTSSLNTGRYWHTATFLSNGKVVVAGGFNNTTGTLNTAELYDPGTIAIPNQIDDVQFFVTEHYRDFLNREPDANGLAFWTNEIASCGGDAQCIDAKRINVSAAYFLSIEFQQTGYLVYRIYKASYGNLPDAPVPLRLNEFLPDTQKIGQGVIVNQTGWEQALENNKQAFAIEFVGRSRFTSAYPTSMSPGEFVDKLFANAGVTPSAVERAAAINEFGSAITPSDSGARARALRRVSENPMLTQQEFNRAFVLMQYFGYLRRNPNDAPDADTGYNFWLNKLDSFNGNFVNAEMVKAFIVSDEYRHRFGP